MKEEKVERAKMTTLDVLHRLGKLKDFTILLALGQDAGELDTVKSIARQQVANMITDAAIRAARYNTTSTPSYRFVKGMKVLDL
jgi:hypothetical protein